jgi:EAL domain-containing protein (putative c-di-GMP-specific phosphodiesterase class I)
MMDTNTITTLQQLKALGVRLAIDDFGTGYSSLSYLKRLPVDSLKIDRSFIDGLERDTQNQALVAAIIAAARALNLSVTAEGIETVAQLNELQKLRCHEGQGFLFARPSRVDEISRILQRSEQRSFEYAQIPESLESEPPAESRIVETDKPNAPARHHGQQTAAKRLRSVIS